MDMTKDYEKCPLCGGDKIKRRLRTSTWSIFSCVTCTNAWTSPPPAPKNYENENFHGQFSLTEIKSLSPEWRKACYMQADLLCSRLPDKSSILEIGCGQGMMLREFKRRGYRTCGIEPSVSASKFARETGLDVITGSFPNNDLEGPFNAVLLSQVLEHITDPIPFLKSIQTIAPGGYVLFVQTNWRGLVPRIKKEKWYAWVPDQHFWHFTSCGLSFIISKIGWRVITIEYSSLSHGNSLASRIGARITGLGDQFHLLAKIH